MNRRGYSGEIAIIEVDGQEYRLGPKTALFVAHVRANPGIGEVGVSRLLYGSAEGAKRAHSLAQCVRKAVPGLLPRSARGRGYRLAKDVRFVRVERAA
jgi:hypothetical protein